MAGVVSKLDAQRHAQSEQMDTVAAFLKDTNLPRDLSKK